jgi:hypothetical protein
VTEGRTERDGRTDRERERIVTKERTERGGRNEVQEELR